MNTDEIFFKTHHDLVRPIPPRKKRKCLKCQAEMYTSRMRLCGSCNEHNKRISSTATIKPMRDPHD
jgi:hypothetical protein